MDEQHFAGLKTYQELNEWRDDRVLTDRVRACVDVQKRAAGSVLQSAFTPDRQAAVAAVSEEALRLILQSGRNVHGIATDREISNVIVFNAKNIHDAVFSSEARTARKLADKAVAEKIKQYFPSQGKLALSDSGYFWYPPGAYMAWHTNSGAPGWRLYVSYAEEPGKSFFRYRDPDSHEIITSVDDEWNVRLFAIRADKPFWHAIYSETNRFSLGYMIYPHSLRTLIGQQFKRLLRI